ncbi:unnamed protein product [Arabidopsis halleri]
MVSLGLSFTLVFLLAIIFTVAESKNTRKLLPTPTNYQPLYSPSPSPYRPPVTLASPPPPPAYSRPVALPPTLPIPHPSPHAERFYYRQSPPPPSGKPWWWLL